ncbi:MAG: hypothetical protein EVJ47_03240 [Candidatus Acidulodesulfobacterium ferriphilum]|uniref:Prepilin-type N-terminal cleavage/methylation domain-containing protein n=1 Tax=Candidatus Acidulodesulfobacterium ferriphilum TaxID=2597223 RepID=A0A519BDF3_9DELT|nr:MAG: hypothetical protein EVJ47_03240 [Candidatus Acidulodesulfobacterium ferriphilum]
MNKSLNKRHALGNKGLTIVELIIALVISLLVVGAASFILLSQSGVFRVSRSVSTEQQRLNTAFNTVKYSLRMAGFDYGQGIFMSAYVNAAKSAAPPLLPPVQIVQAAGVGNPYEVLVMYDTAVNPADPCTITSVAVPNGSATFTVSGGCSAGDFTPGQIINIINPVFAPKAAASPPPAPITLCVTKVTAASNQIQANPGNGAGGVGAGAGAVCTANPNAVPPDSVAGGSVSVLKQVLFYWGNVGTPGQPATYYNFNAPFNYPGALYECTVGPNAANPNAPSYVLEPPYYSVPPAAYTPPTCLNGNAVKLDSYVSSFNIMPVAPPPALVNNWPVAAGLGFYAPTYSESLSVMGESNVALSDSPAYSINVPYNGALNGVNAKGNAGQTIGNNILKSLNSNVFLRNIFYGS